VGQHYNDAIAAIARRRMAEDALPDLRAANVLADRHVWLPSVPRLAFAVNDRSQRTLNGDRQTTITTKCTNPHRPTPRVRAGTCATCPRRSGHPRSYGWHSVPAAAG